MAKVTTPFLSRDASGTLAGLLTATKRARRHYIQYAKPPRSGAPIVQSGNGAASFGTSYFALDLGQTRTTGSQKQLARRFYFASGWKVYALLSPTDKLLYDNLAQPFGISGAQFFIGDYLRRRV